MVLFTGLVEEVATVRRIERHQNSAHIQIEAHRILDDVQLGDSIAVNGVCLTVVDITRQTFTADAVPETMRKTNLGHLHSGDKVNVERAMKATSRFGGHLVSGHVDGVGILKQRTVEDIAVNLFIETPQHILRYIAEKGSICVDGTSLTVVSVTDEGFSVSIIPHTGKHTTLLNARLGQWMNLEVDIVAKYLERLLFGQAGQHTVNGESTQSISRIDTEFLARHGFL
jgi:riboflavin synthase